MANRLRLLHTSPVHVARFDRIRDRIAPDLLLDHLVREDWLDRARRSGIDDILKGEIAAEIGPLTLCTCSTLGPIAEELGAHRIDRPMMRAAAQSGGRTFFRLRAHGFADEDETRRFCAALLAENASCIAVTQR